VKGKLMPILLVVVVLIAAAFAYLYFTKKTDSPADTNTSTTKEEDKPEDTEGAWNPFATTSRHVVPLSDFLVSASGGDHVVKMSVTIELKDEASYKKFEGLEDEKAKEEASHGETDETTKTPMEVVINSGINDAMMSMKETSLFDVKIVEKDLKEKLNARLGLGDDFVKAVYVHNYLVQ
jgi:flagellar basal body-associated protein FliL